MNKKSLIKYYLVNFLISIVLIVTIISTILRFTVLSDNFIRDSINNSDFVNLLHEDIKEQVDENLMSTGFRQDIIEELYSKNALENETNKLIDSLTKDNKYEFDTKEFEDNLKNNVNEFLSKNKLSVEQDEISSFIKEITKVYKNNMIIYNYVPKIKTYYNLGQIITTIISILGIIIFLIYLFNKRKELNKYIPIPLFFTSFVLIFFYSYIHINFDIIHFTFYSNSVSVLIRTILINILNIILVIGIISFILGILTSILKNNKCH